MSREINKDYIIGILKQSGTITDISNIAEDAKFTDNGLDSLDLTNLFFELESDLGISIPENEIPNLQNIKSLITYLNQIKEK